ncbi:MAG TPA: hypothetical protein VH721_00595, partial [Gaiellaceae bacterium]
GETAELVADLLGDSDAAADVSARVAAAAEGNPLFVEEMVAMLIDDGHLVREDDRWVAAGDLSEAKVPPTVQALIAARLDRLDPVERAVLERAAVVGKVFSAAAVRALSGDRSGDVEAGIRSLVRKDLVRPDRDDLGWEDAYRFRHILVLDAAYEAMPKEVRAELHQGFADWLAGDAPFGELDEFVGYHLERSYRYREELGPVDDAGRAMATQAGERLLAAGERAAGRGDVTAAQNLLTRSMALLPATDPRALLAMPVLAQAMLQAGELDRALEFVDEASRRAAEAGSGAIAARLALQRAMTKAHLGGDFQMGQSLEETERHLATLEAAGDDLGLAEGWSNVGVFRFWLGDGAGSREALERARMHAKRAGSPALLRLISNEFLGPLLWGPIPSDEAIRLASELLEEQEAAGGASPELPEAIGAAHAMRGEADLADEFLERGLQRARELGQRLHLAAIHPQLDAGLLLGRYAETERLALGSVEQLREIGETGYLATSLIYLADAIASQGRTEEAEAVLEEAEPLSAEDDAVTMIGIRRLRARILQQRGRLDEAERLAREAIAFAEPTDYLFELGASRQALGEILLANGERDEGLEQLRAALPFFERKGILVLAEPLRARIAEVEAGG